MTHKHMANSITYKETEIKIGDSVTVSYKIKEGAKERIQLFKGILMKVKGKDDATRSITVRRVSNDGIGIERIIPVASPFLADITVDKKSNSTKAKINFIRGLSGSQLRRKLYKNAPRMVK